MMDAICYYKNNLATCGLENNKEFIDNIFDYIKYQED